MPSVAAYHPENIFRHFMKGSPLSDELEKLKPDAKTVRAQMSDTVSEMEKLHIKVSRALQSAAKSYRTLVDKEKIIFRNKHNAADWPEEIF